MGDVSLVLSYFQSALQVILTRTMRRKHYYYYLLTGKAAGVQRCVKQLTQDITLINDKVIAVEKPGGK